MTNREQIENWTCVGVILGAHGITGGLKVKSFCEVPRVIEKYNPLKVEGYPEPIALKIIGKLKDCLQATIIQIEDRDSAIKLQGKLLFAKRNKLPKIDEDEYYFTDLIGLTVQNTDEALIGEVKNVENHGAGTFLEIQLTVKLETVLVPFDKNSIPTVNMTKRYIILNESK